MQNIRKNAHTTQNTRFHLTFAPLPIPHTFEAIPCRPEIAENRRPRKPMIFLKIPTLAHLPESPMTLPNRVNSSKLCGPVDLNRQSKWTRNKVQLQQSLSGGRFVNKFVMQGVQGLAWHQARSAPADPGSLAKTL